ncbi:MAG: YciI family protein [Deltaproteobacteria bacterium]|nr:YciI family protein [Deltaproteobacteria bacterium]MBI3387106.1 YciI family protein [Deltaproteobacteria bacterium]
MRYLMMICDVETQQLKPGDPEFEELMAEYAAFTEMVEKLGILRDSGKLQPTTAATTVRVRHGKTLRTDGPFAETKEQLGGFYILDCTDLDHALELAAKIPTARNGSIEVRPLLF